jgi:hypothetical protein
MSSSPTMSSTLAASHTMTAAASVMPRPRRGRAAGTKRGGVAPQLRFRLPDGTVAGAQLLRIGDPAAGVDGLVVHTFKAAMLDEPAKSRSFLEPLQIEALLEAAREQEREARGLTWEDVRMIRASDRPAVVLARELRVSDVLIGKIRRGELWNGRPGPRRRNDVARVAPILTYVLAGPRVSEGCGILHHHVDLAGARVHIAGTKTSAGDRGMPLLPALHETVQDHVAAWPGANTDPLYVTRNGRANTPNNVRKTILDPALERANEILEAPGPRADPPPDPAHAAADLRVDPGRGRGRPAPRQRHGRPRRLQAHARRLPAGPRPGRRPDGRAMGRSLDDAYELLGGRLGRRRGAGFPY